MKEIQLTPLSPNDREQFILDNQEAFRYGAMQEFGVRNERFEEDGEIISRDTIAHCLGRAKPTGLCWKARQSAAW